MELIANVKVPRPPLHLQQQYAQIVKKHDRLRAQQQEALRQAEHLFQTLLARAFRGELRTKDEGEGMKDEGGARRKEG